MNFSRDLALAISLAACVPSAAVSRGTQSQSPSQYPAAEPHTQYEPIVSALRTQQFNEAVALTRSALAQTPNDPQLWTLQGVALASGGDTAGARSAFQHALKLAPSHVMALQGAAQLEFQAGTGEAAPLLNRLLQLRPADPTVNAMLGVLRYRQGDCVGAAHHFQKAGSFLDSQRNALHAFAVCLVRLKKFDSAEKVFQRTVALSQGDSQERRLLAAIQLMARKPRDAASTLAPLIESGNPDAETLELAAAAYEDSGDTPRAVDSLRRAILLDPKNINLYLDFAHISYQHQSFQVGVNVVGEGIAQLPSAASLYLARGVLYVQLAEYDKAEADFDKAHEVDPNQSLSAAAQGMAAVQENDLDRALSTVQSKLARKPNDAYLLYLQADILSQKGAAPGTPEFESAMASAQKAVAFQPGLAEARSVLAKLDLLAGHNQQAADQCRKALEGNPNDQAALYRLIQALQKSGNKKEIPDLLKRLAQLREQSAKEERDRSRYKLIDSEDSPPQPPTRP